MKQPTYVELRDALIALRALAYRLGPLATTIQREEAQTTMYDGTIRDVTDPFDRSKVTK